MKIYLNTIGCRLNQSEIETYARQFRAAGHTLVSDPAEADLTVVNTCTVTTAAAADSRKMIRAAARAGSGEVIATGCWATMEPMAAAGLPGVSSVVLNDEKDELVSKLLQIQPEAFDMDPVAREPIPGARLRTRAFIKVQDGCDNHCTFCITTVARGKGRSRAKEEILADIQAAIAGGAQEVVLTGVHLGSWGQDFAERAHLRDLVTYLLENSDAPRIRLSSLEPWDLDADFFSLWQNQRLARHLHLPLQSGSAATLRRMARKTTPDDFAQLVQAARTAIPEIAITTDVIVAFPGESESEFAESMAFVRQINFAGGHVFTYSARPGTGAARMSGHVDHALRKSRNAQMRAVFEASARQYQNQFIGQELPVLWESATALGPQGWTVSGLTDNYLRVTAQAPRTLWNVITTVKLTQVNNQGLIGVIPVTSVQ
ncbi:MAG: tRNA (N(6)-L-threonylcarbamoyladenosine(37)-C(2))-methylthiotransferase MtaB [Anaerolineae bacterium]|nr:tRNA (N(6)-L-threonylcarbamoyladenosine(37)-C(2))-methylthiotransferase MtaB [Anaerolineae bacterium]